MPFIPQKRRDALKQGGKPETVGDITYMAYKVFIERWKEERRWTTAHNILKDIEKISETIYRHVIARSPELANDVPLAVALAWQVFFAKEVIKYENEKEKENGSIQ